MTDHAPNGVRRWQDWIPTIGIFLSCMVGMITYVVQIANINTATAQNSERIKDLERRASVANERIADGQTKITILQADLREVETQFCGSDIVRNLMHANEMRSLALLWEKAFSIKMPTDNAYYPVICNRQASK